jgi:glycosyltransferase involved in cell wall biosynthesis
MNVPSLEKTVFATQAGDSRRTLIQKIGNAERPSILFITSVYPHGPDYGAQQRVANILRLLAQIGDVSVIFVCPEPFDETSIDTTRDMYDVKLAAGVRSAPLRSWRERMRFELDPVWMNGNFTAVGQADSHAIRQLLDRYDVTWVHTLQTANEAGIWRWPRSVLDIDFIPSRLYASSATSSPLSLRRLLDRRMALIWRRRERLVHRRFDAVTVCSDVDRAYLGRGNVHVVPNGFTAADSAPRRGPVSPPRLGFVGWLDAIPNRSGVEWFLQRAWPSVKRQVPDARLRLVGAGADALTPAPDVDRLGYLPDPADEISSWSAMIVPIRIGAGTRVKIAHAFSASCPVVSTSLGAFGYDVESDRELLIADTPESFAAACVRVLRDPQLARELADRAWVKYSTCWTWEAIAPAVGRTVTSVMSAPMSPLPARPGA